MLAEEGITRPPAAPDAAADEPPADIRAVFHAGSQSTSPSRLFGVGERGEGQLSPLIAEYRHVRDDPSAQPDSNVGWLEGSGLVKGTAYRCSCDVWIPSGFNGKAVSFVSSGAAVLAVAHADLAKTDEWQTVSVEAAADRDVVDFVLCCDSGAGAFFYSRKWCFGAGALPIGHDRATTGQRSAHGDRY